MLCATSSSFAAWNLSLKLFRASRVSSSASCIRNVSFFRIGQRIRSIALRQISSGSIRRCERTLQVGTKISVGRSTAVFGVSLPTWKVQKYQEHFVCDYLSTFIRSEIRSRTSRSFSSLISIPIEHVITRYRRSISLRIAKSLLRFTYRTERAEATFSPACWRYCNKQTTASNNFLHSFLKRIIDDATIINKFTRRYRRSKILSCTEHDRSWYVVQAPNAERTGI